MIPDPVQPALPASFSPSTLTRNLEALAVHQPNLVRRISWPVDGSHVLLDERGDIQYRLSGSSFPLALPLEETVKTLPHADQGKDLFVCGIGLGEQIDSLLERFPGRRITAWEKDPWLLRLFLMRKDYGACLASGTLRLSLGTDLIRHVPMAPSFTAILHPLLKNVYHNEVDLLVSGIGEKRVIMNTGGLFVDDVARALRSLGFTPFTLNLSGISLEEIDYSIIQFMPQILFSINYQNGLAELAAKFNLTLLCWEIDHSIDTLTPLAQGNEKAHIFTYRKRNRQEFLRAGFSNVEFLPMASDPEVRKPVILSGKDRETYSAAVSFVGNILSRQARSYRKTLSDLHQEYSAARAIPGDTREDPFEEILRKQALDFTRYRLPEEFLSRFSGFADYFRKRTGTTIDPVKLLAETAAAEKRLLYVSRLSRFGVKVWGDEGWKVIHGPGIQYMGPAGHRLELNKIYSGSCINLEVNRIYQMDMLNMRIFDIMACGGFVLAEFSEDLEDLFDLGREVVSYRTLDDLEDKVHYYLSHPEEAREIARRGMDAVLERHTVRQRVETMLSVARRSGDLPGSQPEQR